LDRKEQIQVILLDNEARVRVAFKKNDGSYASKGHTCSRAKSLFLETKLSPQQNILIPENYGLLKDQFGSQKERAQVIYPVGWLSRRTTRHIRRQTTPRGNLTYFKDTGPICNKQALPDPPLG
jgi:hypothetical protein